MAGYGLFGRMLATPGQGGALAAHLLEAAEALQDVAGCRRYLVSRDRADPDAVCVYEEWDDADAHEGSLQLPAVQQLIASARPIIASMGERFELDPAGGMSNPK